MKNRKWPGELRGKEKRENYFLDSQQPRRYTGKKIMRNLGRSSEITPASIRNRIVLVMNLFSLVLRAIWPPLVEGIKKPQ